MSDPKHPEEADRLQKLVGQLKPSPQAGEKVDLGEALRYVADPGKRIKVVTPGARRINVTSPGARRVDPEWVAEILGAERMFHPSRKGASFDDFRTMARRLMRPHCPVCRSAECRATDYSTIDTHGSVRRQCDACGKWYHPEEALAIALMQAYKQVPP